MEEVQGSATRMGKERERIVRFLLKGPARLEPSANPLRPLLRLADGGDRVDRSRRG